MLSDFQKKMSARLARSKAMSINIKAEKKIDPSEIVTVNFYCSNTKTTHYGNLPIPHTIPVQADSNLNDLLLYLNDMIGHNLSYYALDEKESTPGISALFANLSHLTLAYIQKGNIINIVLKPNEIGDNKIGVLHSPSDYAHSPPHTEVTSSPLSVSSSRPSSNVDFRSSATLNSSFFSTLSDDDEDETSHPLRAIAVESSSDPRTDSPPSDDDDRRLSVSNRTGTTAVDITPSNDHPKGVQADHRSYTETYHDACESIDRFVSIEIMKHLVNLEGPQNLGRYTGIQLYEIDGTCQRIRDCIFRRDLAKTIILTLYTERSSLTNRIYKAYRDLHTHESTD